jgi:hypothetical protein
MTELHFIIGLLKLGNKLSDELQMTEAVAIVVMPTGPGIYSL